jgi:KDO2-lipid IV(A) lauroyltransferase
MYYIVFGLLYLLSLLPYWVLYGIADLLAYLLFAVFRYRRRIVYENIRNSFPEMNEKQVNKLCHAFYRNFTANWFETIKLISISPERLMQRVSGNFEIFQHPFEQGRKICLVQGHIFNWEMLGLAFSLKSPSPSIFVYMPLSNKNMDRLFQRLRSRFSAHLIAATSFNKEIISWRRKQYAIGLLADQSPGNPTDAHWLQFLNQPTAFVTGPERNTIVFGQVPFFVNISRSRKGRYHFQFEPLFPDGNVPREKGAVTRAFAEKLELNVRQHPELYLWSHRRWKHQWSPAYEGLWVDKLHELPVEKK